MNQQPGYGQYPGYPGYPGQPPPPPPKKGMGLGFALLIGVGLVGALGVGSCLVIVALAHKNHSAAATETPVSSLSTGIPDELTQDEATARALAACHSLSQTGVATNCQPQIGGRLRDNVGWGIATFNVVGAFPNDQGMITCYRTAADYHKTEGLPQSAADDYPDLTPSSAKTRLAVSLSTTDSNTDKWDDCMEKKRSTVAGCAKLYPKQYAAFHALYDADRKLVDDELTRQAVLVATNEMNSAHAQDKATTSRFLDQCKDIVRSKLTFPDTADFHYVGIALQVVVLDGGGRVWRSDVTGKNAFGMEVKHNFTCSLDPKKGLTVEIE